MASTKLRLEEQGVWIQHETIKQRKDNILKMRPLERPTSIFVVLFSWLASKDAMAWMSFPSSLHSNTNAKSIHLYAGTNQQEQESESDETTKGPTSNSNSRRRLLSQSTFALASALGLNLGSIPTQNANAIGGGLDASELRRIDIFEKVAPSVVFIDTFTERRDVFTTNVMEVPLGTGSGFVWDNEGHIITNYHVIRDSKAS